jgi:hypothetical protein
MTERLDIRRAGDSRLPHERIGRSLDLVASLIAPLTPFVSSSTMS